MQLLPQLGILCDQLLPLHLQQPVNTYPLRDHRGDDLQELQQPLELPVCLVDEFDRQRADDPAMEYDGYAHEAELAAPPFPAHSGTMEEAGIPADQRHNHGLA